MSINFYIEKGSRILHYLVFTQSRKYGKERVTYKGILASDSVEVARKRAKEKFGKLAFIEVDCILIHQKYKKQIELGLIKKREEENE